MKRYATYRSELAPVARFFGGLSLAVVLLAVGMHRLNIIAPWVMSVSLVVAAALGALAIALAAAAFVRLWARGGFGYWNAQVAVLLGMTGVAPVCVIAWIWVVAPPLTDVATDPIDPPIVDDGQTQTFNLMGNATLAQRLLAMHVDTRTKPPSEGQDINAALIQKSLYEDIVPRRYRMSPARLHLAMRQAAAQRGWTLKDELPPDLPDTETRAQFVARSPILGTGADISVRIRPDAVGALLDIRSVSHTPIPDFTGNADRIRALFSAIDVVLTDTYGSLDQLAVLEDEFEDEETATIESEPAQDLAPSIPTPGFKPYFEGEDSQTDPVPGAVIEEDPQAAAG